MTTRSTTYAKADSGQLEVIFSSQFTVSVTGDAGFPANGEPDIVLECTVSDSGGQLAKAYINRASPSAHLLFDYPGGSVSWTAAMSNVYQSFGGGVGSMGVVPKVSFILVKR